jgi:Maintenance of mitochondrial structure and function
MQECEAYIKDVIEGRTTANPEIARALNQCISQFSTDDLQLLEGMVKENFHDAVMVNTLAKLQHAQITMTEKLNDIFVQSVNKGSSRHHHHHSQGGKSTQQL